MQMTKARQNLGSAEVPFPYSIIYRPAEFTRAVKGHKSSSVQTRGRSLNKSSDALRLCDVRLTSAGTRGMILTVI